MKTFNTVTVGCGAVAAVHLQSVSKSKNAVVYGVCDIKPNAAEEYAVEYGCKAFSSLEEVLGDDKVDSVHICTPHFLHIPMLIKTVKAGKMAVIEKPVAMNIKEYQTAKKIVDECGVPVCSVIQNRYNNCIMRIKSIIDEGKYGRVLGLKGYIAWNRPRQYYLESDWRGRKDTEGGALVINQSLHTLDLLCYLGGTPEYIKASVDTRVLGDVIDVEDTAEATIYLENGILAHFYGTNNFSTNASYDIEVNFEQCSLRYIFGGLYEVKNNEVTEIEHDKLTTSGKAYWGISHETLVDNFYACMAGEDREYTDFGDALLSVRLVDGIYKSAATGKKIKL